MPAGRRATVVDTNVAIVANRRAGGSYACASACAQELLYLRSKGKLLVDDQGLILDEYKNYLNYRGQPGVGDAFLRWLFNNRGKEDLCATIAIQPIQHEWRQFEEFPDDETLKSFDRSDQKFVAVAQSAGNAQIIQAADHKWLTWHKSLEKHNVKIRFLCEEELQATLIKKSK